MNIHCPDLLPLPLKQFKKFCFKSTLFNKLSQDLINTASNCGFYLNQFGIRFNSKSNYYQVNFEFKCTKN